MRPRPRPARRGLRRGTRSRSSPAPDSRCGARDAVIGSPSSAGAVTERGARTSRRADTSTTAPATISPSSAAAMLTASTGQSVQEVHRAVERVDDPLQPPLRSPSIPPSSPTKPAPGVAAASATRISRSLSRSVCVTTSVGELFVDKSRQSPARGTDERRRPAVATATAIVSRSAAGGRQLVRHGAPRRRAPRSPSTAPSSARCVGDQHVDLVEAGEAEQLVVAELRLVDDGHDAAGATRSSPA